jgi:WD40 repeat protein
LSLFAAAGVILWSVALIIRESEPGPGAKDRPFGQITQDDRGEPVWALATSPRTRWLAAATISGEVWVKDLASGQSIRLQGGPWSSARSLAFSADGRVLAVAGIETAVRFFDAESGAELEPLAVEGRASKYVAFAPDGELVAISERRGERAGGVVLLRGWPTRRRLAVLAGHATSIIAMAFARDSSWLATGDSTGVIKVWDTATGRERAGFRADARGTFIRAMAAAPDGTLLATAGFLDREVRLWDLSTGEPRGTVPGTPLGVNALAFSPDGTMLATARGDGTATLWDVAERRVAGTVGTPGGSLESVAFQDDGRTLVTGGVDGVVRRWDLAQVLDGAAADRHPEPSDRAGRDPERVPGPG